MNRFLWFCIGFAVGGCLGVLVGVALRIPPNDMVLVAPIPYHHETGVQSAPCPTPTVRP